MYDVMKELYDVIERRRVEHEEGSYTAYLFDNGLDKALKKLGEETAETIIAAKNLETCVKERLDCEEAKKELEGEAGDVLYHLVVMLDMLGVEVDEVEDLLRLRMNKTNNLKEYSQTKDGY